MKKKILTLLLIIFPLLVTIGFSTWIIIYEFVFSPTYQENHLSEAYGFSQKTVYNGNPQVPILREGYTINGDISYKYKLSNQDSYTDGKPVNAGIYDVVITVTGEDAGQCQVQYTIEPKNIQLVKTVIELNYTDCDPWWSSMSTKIKSNISFVDDKGNIATELIYGDYYISGIHNGVYYYGDSGFTVNNLTTTTYIAGSTYLCEVFLHDDLVNNYVLKTGNKIQVKYKTVSINGTLFTIEDAIAYGSGEMILLGSTSNYIETCFSKILGTNSYTINNSRKLRVPYDDSYNDFIRTYQNGLSGIYSTLLIPEGIILNLEENSNSKLVVGGAMDGFGAITRHAVIMNNGTINLYSTCELGSYGFTKGSGLVNVFAGAEAIDVFRLYDWPGADEALDLKNNNAFPVKQWSVYNISCKTRVYKDGLYNSVSFIVALSGLTTIPVTDIFIVGNDDTDNCLFKPSSSAVKDDYIEKSANISNDDYTKSNQVWATENKISIFGDYKDAAVMVNASGYSFSTNTSMAIPIDYYSIVIEKNSKLTLSASSYIFTSANSNIYVKENAILDINGSAYMALLNNSTLYMDDEGSTLSGNGSFAGKISVGCKNSILKISNYDKYIDDSVPVVLKTGATTYSSFEVLSSGNLKVGNDYLHNQQFTDGLLYISDLHESAYYYIGASEDEFNTYEIIYHTNGGSTLTPDSIPSFENSYYVSKDSLQKTYRNFYTLEGWYTDESCSPEHKFSGTTLTSSNLTLNLYAKWEYKIYSFAYAVAYEDPSKVDYVMLNNDQILSNLNGSFTYGDLLEHDITISTTAVFEDKNFYGWYVGANDKGVMINKTFKKEHLEAIVNNGDIDEIPLFGVFKDYKQYTIYFVDNNSDFEDPEKIPIKSNENITLPDTSDYDNNSNKLLYCQGWYYTENKIESSKIVNGTKLSSIISKIDVVNEDEIYLYGNWMNKEFKLTYKFDSADGTEIPNTTQYFRANQSVIIHNSISRPSIDGESNSGTQVDYSFSKWQIDGVDYSTEQNVKFTESKIVVGIYEQNIKYRITIINNAGNGSITVSFNDGSDSYTESSSKGDTRYIYRPSGIGFKLSASSRLASISSPSPNLNKDSSGYYLLTSACSFTVTGWCFTEGTMITLADGRRTPVENLNQGDYLLVFNHETGRLDYAPASFIIHSEEIARVQRVINLRYSNNTIIKIVSYHGFYDKTLSRYVYINEDNVINYIGHEFYVEDGTTTKLVDYSITEEYTRIFSPISYYHLNVFANGILTVTNFSEVATNIFEYDENMKYDEEKMMKDIETYGLFTYEDFKEYTTEEIYNAFPAQYFKVAIGKGKGTYEDIIWILNTFLQ